MSDKNRYIEHTFREQKQRLLNFIKKSLTADQAEDVLQDVFIQLFNGYEQIKALDSITSWLYKTANNKIIDFKRKKKPDLLGDKKTGTTNKDGDYLFLEDILPALNDSPEDDLFRKVIWDEIMEALDELPEEQKEVFVLHELEDLSFEEISIKTGKKINTLLSRKRYAILFLRERLNEIYEQLKD